MNARQASGNSAPTILKFQVWQNQSLILEFKVLFCLTCTFAPDINDILSDFFPLDILNVAINFWLQIKY